MAFYMKWRPGRPTVALGQAAIGINWPDEYYLSDVMYTDSEDMIDSKQLDVNVVTLKYKTKHDYLKYQTAEDIKLLENNDQESRKDPIKGDDLHTSAESKSLDSCQTFERESADKLSASDRVSGNCTEHQKEEYCKECREGDLPGMNQNVLKVVEESDQFNILKELYHFEAPKSSNKEELRQKQEKRAAQLSDLKNAITWCLEGDVGSAHTDTDNLPKSWQKMLGLIKDLKVSRAEPLNGELLHMAGEMTCNDEGDLFVSSDEEIGALMVQVQEVLSGIPKPTMVTIARSSLDDYCPKMQVGRIQELVIKMLNDLYTDVEVQKDYEEEINFL
ncbi:hypothetical protein BSL78_05445 [Apostichopus japonicus]|uniref:Uncharacterized protein n=1 Tax=Stichopus japonicus TaxID=307972 RepID=A0A2G8LBJ2_STIJA|nr:hypothetical protein BSL78_05445 [Apostichopus japonicus]